MSRENEEDVSGIDDIFDDNKDNINKFPKSGETSVSDSDTIVDQEKTELEQDTIQEDNGTYGKRRRTRGRRRRRRGRWEIQSLFLRHVYIHHHDDDNYNPCHHNQLSNK